LRPVIEGQTAAIIAGASAVGGGLIVAGSNYVVSRLQAAETEKRDVKRSLVDLLDALSRIEQRLRLEPKPGRAAQAVNKTMAARTPLLDYAATRLHRRLIDPTLDELSAHVSRALAAATVMAPLNMLSTLGTLTELMGEAASPREDWWDRWETARTDYVLLCREVVGSGLGAGALARVQAVAVDSAPTTPDPAG
jgi:hypothetical protein